MAAAKRRKIDGSGSSTPTSAVGAMSAKSAFAARKELWGATTNRGSHGSVESGQEDVAPPGKSEPSTRSLRKRPSPKEPAAEPPQKAEREPSMPPTSSVEAGGMAVRQHSSFRPTKKNLQRKAGGVVVLSTLEAERLVILGSYGVKVCEGEATVAGAVLTPSDGIQWVHAPSCHAVPVLRTADDTVLELQPHQAAKDLRQLAKLNPSFGRLWNETSVQVEGTSRAKSPGTFQIIYTSEDVPKGHILQELASPAEWNKKLSGLIAAKRKGTPVVFLCGPKSSGKSTFGKILANRLMTDRAGSKNKPWSNIMVLDLDPGQPEYSPPGVISLSKITSPNLAPSFCHPTLTPAEGQVRAHAIASVSPALDPTHFIECALDLFNHYRRGPDFQCPLVINTPGWIQGTGLDILSELVAAFHPTEVIYMSENGPEDTVNTLRSACSSTSNTPGIFTTLPSQPSDLSSRTALDFRTMQTMSYFHLRSPPTAQQQQQQHPAWDPTPLTAVRPWRVRYTGEPGQRGILGILCYDYQPAPSLLAEAINGTVMALVQLESRDALRGLALPSEDGESDHIDNDGDNEEDDKEDDEADNDEDDEEDDDNDNPDQTKTKTQPPTQESHPLPLISNPSSLALSPAHSHLVALVLLRGIDTARGELQLLSPLLTPETMPALAGTDLVLVAGKFDMPTWAYTEDLYLKEAEQRKGGKGQGQGQAGSGSASSMEDDDGGQGGDGDGEAEEGEDGKGPAAGGALAGQTEVPWVEVLHGSQKRAVGSQVWRVRRDLGRN